MENEFIPYEEALALKELGFDKPCFGFWLSNKTIQVDTESGAAMLSAFGNVTYFKAPLYQQAFKWFREKYRLQAEILWRGDMGCFCYKTGEFKYGSHEFSENDYNTYEEAELECLKKLIEIVKNK